MSEVDPTCRGAEYQPYCLLFQSMMRTAADGAREVAFTWSPLDTSDGSDDERDDLIGHYAAVDALSGELRWRIDWLDFSGANTDGGCPYDPADPCHPSAELPDDAWQACRLWMPHDLVVVDESDSAVHLWVADTLNNRMLELDAPRDSDCAAVRTVIDAANPDWDIYASNNSIQYRVDDDGTEQILMSAKQSSPRWVGEAQLPGKGKGKIVQWRNAGEGWAQEWEFPPEVAGAESFVSNPHGVTWATDPAGAPLVTFAHSLGAHDEWTANAGEGSVGVLAFGEDGLPAYVADLRLSEGRSLHFPRDVSPMSGDRWLVADSGCVGDDCPYATHAWVVPAPRAEPSGLGGTWSPDHADQHFVEVEVLAGPLIEEATQLYSAEWMSEAIPANSEE